MAPVTDAPSDPPVVAAMRNLLLVAAVLVFLAGAQLFVFTLRTEEYFSWTIGSPMTAVFLGASYWSAIGLEVTAARSSTWSGARIAVPAVFVFTTLTLLVTVVHRDSFHFDRDLPARTQAITWAWLAIYAVVPVLMALAWLAQRPWTLRPPPGVPLARPVRWVLLVIAAGLVGFGTALLVDPLAAADAWPWPLTELTGRAIGAWLVGLGVAAGHAWVLDDRVAVRPLAVTGIAFGLLQLVALARHGDELDWGGAPAAVYVVVVATLGAVSAWTLLGPDAGPSPAPSDAPGGLPERR